MRVFILLWIVLFYCGISHASYELNSGTTIKEDLHSIISSIKYELPKSTVCFVCRLAAEGMLRIYSMNKSQDCLEAIAVQFCKTFNIEDTTVCRSIVSQFKTEVLYVFGHLLLSPTQFCGFILPTSCGKAYNPYADWNVTFPDKPKPPVQQPTLPAPSAPKLRVVHLSDIHFDKLYQPGSNAKCLDPLCCRKYESSDKISFTEAGFWGYSNGNCDIPKWTLESLFQHLKENETFDYIIWTGDLQAHNVWNYSRQDQLDSYKTLTNLFLEYFPNKTIYSTVGNHESAPVDSFPPHFANLPQNYSISWLYNALADHWTHWINKSEYGNIQNFASYSVKPFPRLRIISINTMYCYSTNFWLYLNETDPDNELGWLIKELQDAEDVGDKVHIVGHVLPGQCLPEWSWNYYKIINRYEDTVRAQFFGHTHSDEFGVFYENANRSQRVTSMYYVGPSVTTFVSKNPSYRVYTIDGDYTNSTFRVLNHETYYLNITEANLSNVTKWTLEYDAKSAYQMETLLPQEWSQLIDRMKTNDGVLDKYNFYFDRKLNPCNDECKFNRLCATRSAVSNHPHLCDDLINPNKSQQSNLHDRALLVKSIKNVIRKALDSFMLGVPDQCKRGNKSQENASEQSNKVNLSACWLLYPSNNSTMCRNVCTTVWQELSTYKKKARIPFDEIRANVCNKLFDCCNN